MAQLTLRDIASNEEIVVPPEGFVFGRAGGDADIQLDDVTISRRQARVSSFQGRWVLEVMVVPPGQRLPKPQSLQEGQTFYIGESEFEVVTVEVDEEPALKGAKGAAAAGKPPLPQQKTAPQPASRRPETQTSREEVPDEGARAGVGSGTLALGLQALFVGVPKGVAYSLVNVPAMLFNPLGTVRRTIEQLPSEPLGRTGLIGHALPSLLVTALLGSIAGGLALMIQGGGFALLAFVPVIPAAVAVVVSVVLGFVFHPVLAWIVAFLKGTSDERSRSNFFLQLNTLAILLAVPGALGTLLGALPIPFVNLLGPLLLTVASLVAVYVAYQWFVFFQVAPWFRYLLLGLGALSVLGAAFSLVTGVLDTVRGMGQATVAVAPPVLPADADGVLRAAREAAEKAAALEAERDAQAAAARARRPTEGPRTPAEETQPPRAAARPHEEPAPADEARATAAPSTGYGAFVRRREAVERLLAADPTLLTQDSELKELYGSFAEAAYKVERRFAKDIAREPERARLHEHLRDAELFRQAGPRLDKVAQRLHLP
jgi:hypothetical protein